MGDSVGKIEEKGDSEAKISVDITCMNEAVVCMYM